ncbi:Electron transfer flavoprotein subunit alpha [Marinobacterium sp. xm-d-564]|nr:Electron transfer flavoprotein subunit alpha [Marinobacterium sp. xm-d-564]
MMKTLIIAEHDSQSLKGATLSAVTAATKLGAPVDVLVVGSSVAAAAAQAASVAGVDRVLTVEDSALEHSLAEFVAPIAKQLAGDYTHVILGASTFGKDLAPRVAALCGVNQLSEVIEVIDAETFKRPIYAGNAIATVKSSDALKVMTVRGTAFAAAETGGSAAVEAASVTVPAAKVRFVGAEVSESDRPELESADIVVSGGRGVGSKEDFAKVFELADKLGAAVGASRAAVDSGFVPNDMQVGQTGKMVAPKLYIAVGISGAIQHLAGMKESGTIVAINKDEEAPIFNIADYGLVGDLHDILPELVSKV